MSHTCPSNVFIGVISRFRLIGSAGAQNGIIQAAGCFFSLYVVMAQFGFMPKYTTGIRAKWDNNAINNLEDSYGQEWVKFASTSMNLCPSEATEFS